MKTKITILGSALILTLLLFSFSKNQKADDSQVAIVSQMNGKGENEGFIITYGDGTVEKKPFDIKLVSHENMISLQSKTAEIMNEMHEKGYRYSGAYVSNLSYMIFEKK